MKCAICGKIFSPLTSMDGCTYDFVETHSDYMRMQVSSKVIIRIKYSMCHRYFHSTQEHYKLFVKMFESVFGNEHTLSVVTRPYVDVYPIRRIIKVKELEHDK